MRSVCARQQCLSQDSIRLWPLITFVVAAAGVGDVVLGSPIGDRFMGTTELPVHTPLSRQDVDGAVVTSGARAVLIRQTLAGDVGTGLVFILQRTIVTRRTVQTGSWGDQICN